MALPAPNLDDRKFQDMVDVAKRYIGQRCPEWSEHNVSDPGVTLIELFAWMTEITLYRLNQVPEKNYIKFLEMIGIDLMAGAAARTGITFPLSAGWPGETVVVPRGTEVATEPIGEDEEPIIFSTDRDLALSNPAVRYVISESGSATRAWDRSSPFIVWGNPAKPGDAIYLPPTQDDALYVGFDRDITGFLLELRVECVTAKAVGMRPEEPQARWEFFNTVRGSWDLLEIVGEDRTLGLDKTGSILFRIPWERFDESERKIDDKPAWWIRYRYVPQAYQYDAAPVITGFQARVLAGTVAASNAHRIEREELGVSEGVPGQQFELDNAPILGLARGETVEVEQEDGGWEPWERRDDFADSGPEDRHFTIDTQTGHVHFGPSLQCPDGITRQSGAIPPPNRTIRFSRYRFGGGAAGNVAPDTLISLRRTISYIVGTEKKVTPAEIEAAKLLLEAAKKQNQKVEEANAREKLAELVRDQLLSKLLQITNPEKAEGGSDREELEHAKVRGQQRLRSLTRAVTPEDYEFHAKQAKPNAVARARCLTPQYPGRERRGQKSPPPGEVRVLIVPAVTSDPSTVEFGRQLQISDALRSEVWRYLDERRLITTRVTVDQPQYLWVSTEVSIRLNPRHERARVRGEVARALHRFLNPLVGGPHWQTPDGKELPGLVTPQDPFVRGPRAQSSEGEQGWNRGREQNEPGWPFGYPIRMADLRAVIQSITGVHAIDSLKVYYRRGESENRVQMRREQEELPSDMLPVSEQHVVNISE